MRFIVKIHKKYMIDTFPLELYPASKVVRATKCLRVHQGECQRTNFNAIRMQYHIRHILRNGS